MPSYVQYWSPGVGSSERLVVGASHAMLAAGRNMKKPR